MTDQVQNTAAAVASPVTFSVGDRTYTIGPLTVNVCGAFERWMQQRAIAIGRDSLSDDMTDAERAEVMDAAFRAAQSVGMDTPEGAALTLSLAGLCQLISLMMIEHEPDMTPEAVRALLEEPASQSAVMDAFDLVRERDGQPPEQKKSEADDAAPPEPAEPSKP